MVAIREGTVGLRWVWLWLAGLDGLQEQGLLPQHAGRRIQLRHLHDGPAARRQALS